MADSSLADEEEMFAALHSLRWHINGASEETVLMWLAQFLRRAEESSLDEMQACAGRATISSSNLVRLLKSSNEEIVDAATRAITYLAGQGEHVSRFKFSPPGEEPFAVRIREQSYAGEGETIGAKIWPSAPELAAILAAHPAIVRGKDVLEIGCGPALCGIAAGLLGARKVEWIARVKLMVAQVVATDYEPSVLANATANTRLNHCEDRTEVVSLDWKDMDSSAVQTTFPCILAADVIYDEWHAAAVPPVIAKFLAPCPYHHQAPSVSKENPASLSPNKDLSSISKFITTGCSLCVAVLGNRTARRGIPIFEENMRAIGLQAVFEDITQELSKYVFVREGCAAAIAP